VTLFQQKNKLTHFGLLAKNTLLNLLGQGVPLIVALVAIPKLIAGLGTDRFGVLTLAWMVIGYFSLFDLGIGRALTKLVSEKLGNGGEEEIPDLIWTGMVLMVVLGLLGAAVAGLLTPALVKVLKIPAPLVRETTISFYLLSGSVPVIIGTAGLRGVLEAFQKFDFVNAIRIPLGIFSFIGPLLAMMFSTSLILVTLVLATGRLLAFVAHVVACLRTVPTASNGKKMGFDRDLMSRLCSYGGWMTVTNIVGPLMVYLDRFLIGAVLSVSLVAYYTTPYEMVTKLWLIPTSLLGVMFPAFSTSFACDPRETVTLFRRSTSVILLAMFPITLLVIVFASDGLFLWLGAEFAHNSTRVLQWLMVGVFLNSLGQVPYALIQGLGRPDLSARLHLLELPFYLGFLWWMLHAFGVEGAAVAWTVRIAVDTVLMFYTADRLLEKKENSLLKTVLTVAITSCLFFFASLLQGVAIKLIFVVFVVLATAMYCNFCKPWRDLSFWKRLHA
jgi:O-antigen/teichoic acid export membrane protein